MNWYALAFVVFLVVVLVLAGYYLVKSFLKEYTYDATSQNSELISLSTILIVVCRAEKKFEKWRRI